MHDEIVGLNAIADSPGKLAAFLSTWCASMFEFEPLTGTSGSVTQTSTIDLTVNQRKLAGNKPAR
jgi:hypothetical protein